MNYDYCPICDADIEEEADCCPECGFFFEDEEEMTELDFDESYNGGTNGEGERR